MNGKDAHRKWETLVFDKCLWVRAKPKAVDDKWMRFRLPDCWHKFQRDTFAFWAWKWFKYELNADMRNMAYDAWLDAEHIFRECVPKTGFNITVFALPCHQKSAFQELHPNALLVDVRNVDAKGKCKDISIWTGLDEWILRYVMSQKETFMLLLLAVVSVAKQPSRPRVVGFMCDGGKHRSVAVSTLFVSLACSKESHVGFLNSQVVEAARANNFEDV